jgi:hypothetical protein
MRAQVWLPAAEVSNLKPDDSTAAGNWQLIVTDSGRDQRLRNCMVGGEGAERLLR